MFLETGEIVDVSLDLCLHIEGDDKEIVLSLIPEVLNRIGINQILPGISVKIKKLYGFYIFMLIFPGDIRARIPYVVVITNVSGNVLYLSNEFPIFIGKAVQVLPCRVSELSFMAWASDDDDDDDEEVDPLALSPSNDHDADDNDETFSSLSSGTERSILEMFWEIENANSPEEEEAVPLQIIETVA